MNPDPLDFPHPSFDGHQTLRGPEIEHALRNGRSGETGFPHSVAGQDVEVGPSSQHVHGSVLGSTVYFAIGRYQRRYDRGAGFQSLLVDLLSRPGVETADHTIGISQVKIVTIHDRRGHIGSPSRCAPDNRLIRGLLFGR